MSPIPAIDLISGAPDVLSFDLGPCSDIVVGLKREGKAHFLPKSAGFFGLAPDKCSRVVFDVRGVWTRVDDSTARCGKIADWRGKG